MAYEGPGAGALDYAPCTYGRSKILFRGPKRKVAGPYIVTLGGSETYGKFVETPWPALLERLTGLPVVNLGCMNAGIDIMTDDPEVLRLCVRSRLAIVQIVGAANMSNRFYTVHPRRNDRFLRASPRLAALFPEVDFTEIHFTRHLLSELWRVSPERFALIEAELKPAWVARMVGLLEQIEGRAVLVALASVPRPPTEALGPDPLLVDSDMLAEVTRRSVALVPVTPSAEALAEGTRGMIFSPLDEAAASGLPGPLVHAEIAMALAPILSEVVG
jgi:hypothetical protein